MRRGWQEGWVRRKPVLPMCVCSSYGHTCSHPFLTLQDRAALSSLTVLPGRGSGPSPELIPCHQELCLYTLGNLIVDSEAVRRQLLPQGIIPALATCMQVSAGPPSFLPSLLPTCPLTWLRELELWETWWSQVRSLSSPLPVPTRGCAGSPWICLVAAPPG